MIEILHPVDHKDRIADVCSDGSGYQFVDGWEHALPELQSLERFSASPLVADETNLDQQSRYIVFPWRAAIVRLPEDELFYRLRTTRNRYLITDEEQTVWSRALVAIAGLSVGASVLNACSLTGARNFRLADPDTLGPSNLNRLSESVCDIGVAKSTLAHRRILERDPYSTVALFDAGYSPDVASAFLDPSGGARPAVVIEEMDNLAMKVDIRRRARDARLPVVMVTDDGDNVIVDVERYDLEPDYPLFHGRAGKIDELSPTELTDDRNRVRIADAIVGSDTSPRTKFSMTEVGKSLASWPQLGTAATLAGAVGAMVARKLVCGDEVLSGRSHIRIDDLDILPVSATR